MDKEILRITIFATGAVIVVAMVLWSFFRNKKDKQDPRFFNEDEPIGRIDESLVLDTSNDDFDIVPIGSAVEDEGDSMTTMDQSPAVEDDEQSGMPALIQFSIAARDPGGFNGLDLHQALLQVGLEYGSMQVYERVDDQRLVDFAVANMLEPGVFPDLTVEEFQCPGIVFFMQPRELHNALAVFEDLMQTMNLLALELDGEKLDPQHQLLTEELMQEYRLMLA